MDEFFRTDALIQLHTRSDSHACHSGRHSGAVADCRQNRHNSRELHVTWKGWLTVSQLGSNREGAGTGSFEQPCGPPARQLLNVDIWPARHSIRTFQKTWSECGLEASPGFMPRQSAISCRARHRSHLCSDSRI